jgi:hypothetical protein
MTISSPRQRGRLERLSAGDPAELQGGSCLTSEFRDIHFLIEHRVLAQLYLDVVTARGPAAHFTGSD